MLNLRIVSTERNLRDYVEVVGWLVQILSPLVVQGDVILLIGYTIIP
jgi:hypothetical protein